MSQSARFEVVLNPNQRPKEFNTQRHCGACKYPLVIDEVIQTACHHFFHRRCFEDHLEHSATCPFDGNSIERTQYQTALKLPDTMEEEDMACSICAHPINTAVIRSSCGHLFHAYCHEDLKKAPIETLAFELKKETALESFLFKQQKNIPRNALPNKQRLFNPTRASTPEVK